MVKFIAILILIVYSSLGFTQNLIPNPSFETISSCPNANGQIGLALPWVDPSGGNSSPDLMNSCFVSGWPSFDVSLNTPGWQNARTGSGYAHIITDYSNMGAPYTDLKEYIQVQLTAPLIAGQVYDVSFFVSNTDHFKFSSNNIGVYISVIPPTSTNYNTLPFTPQINEINVVSDTTNWTLISGTYTASGGEQYITIGNFYHYTLTTLSISNPSTFWALASYFIDDVCVTPQGGAGCTTVLPVTLQNFEAVCYNNNPQISWITTTEINNDYFTIERSADAINWEKVTEIRGAGNSNQQVNYNYIDDTYQINNQTIYYRLKQTDFDGNYEYFKSISINCKDINDYMPQIFPNPATNKVTISGKFIDKIEIIDVTGRTVRQLSPNNETVEINISNFSNGIYFINVYKENSFTTHKMIKK